MSAHTERRAAMFSNRTRKNYTGGGGFDFRKKTSKVSPILSDSSILPASPVFPPSIVPSVNKNNATFLSSFTNFGKDKNNLKDRMYIKLKGDIAKQTAKKDDSAKEWDSVNRKISTNPGGNYIALLDGATKKKNNEIAALDKLNRQMDDTYPKVERDLRDARQSAQAIEAIIFDLLNSNEYTKYIYTQGEFSKINSTTTPADIATKTQALTDATKELEAELNNEQQNVAPIILTLDTLQSQYNDVKNTLDKLTTRISSISAPSSESGWGMLSSMTSSVPLAHATPVSGELGAAVPFSPTDSFIQIPANIVSADVDSIRVELKRSNNSTYANNFYPANIEFFNKSGISEKKVDKVGALEASLFDVKPVVGTTAMLLPTTTTETKALAPAKITAETKAAADTKSAEMGGVSTGMGATATGPTTNAIDLDAMEFYIGECLDNATNTNSIAVKCINLTKRVDAEKTKNTNNTTSSANEKKSGSDQLDIIQHAINVLSKLQVILSPIQENYTKDSSSMTSPLISYAQKLTRCERMIIFIYAIMYYIEVLIPGLISDALSYDENVPKNEIIFGTINRIPGITQNAYNMTTIQTYLSNAFNAPINHGTSFFISNVHKIGIDPVILLRKMSDAKTSGSSSGGGITDFLNNTTSVGRKFVTDINNVGRDLLNRMVDGAIPFTTAIGGYIDTLNTIIKTDNTNISDEIAELGMLIARLIEDGKYYKDVAFMAKNRPPENVFSGGAGRKTRNRAARRNTRRARTMRNSG